MTTMKRRTNFNIIDFLVPMYYFLGTLISSTYYDIYHPISMTSLGIFIVYYFIKFFNDFKMNKFILIFIIIHLFAGLVYSKISDLFGIALYALVIFSFSLVAKFDKNAHYKFAGAIVIMNYINTLVLLFSDAARTRFKTIGGLSIQINYFEDVHFSIAALTALLAIVLVFYSSNDFKGKLFKSTTIIASLYNILTLGKVSILLGFTVAVIVTKLFFFKGRSSKLTKFITNVILISTFLSSFILPVIIKNTANLNINYSLFTGRRDEIWSVYLDYFFQEPLGQKLIGSFFIRTYNDIVQQGIPHPHNQWMTILISLGLIGVLIYFFLFKKAYNYTIKNGDRVGFAYMLALNIYATTDDYVVLTAGCVNAFLLFYFACKNNVPDV